MNEFQRWLMVAVSLSNRHRWPVSAQHCRKVRGSPPFWSLDTLDTSTHTSPTIPFAICPLLTIPLWNPGFQDPGLSLSFASFHLRFTVVPSSGRTTAGRNRTSHTCPHHLATPDEVVMSFSNCSVLRAVVI